MKLKLVLGEGDIPKLRDTMRLFNEAFNYCAQYGFDNKTGSKIKVHKATYYDTRKLFGLPASLATSARDVACEALRGVKLKTCPVADPLSAIRYNQRVLRVCLEHGEASIATIEGRVHATFPFPDYYKRYIEWRVKSATLNLKCGTFYLHLTVEADNPPKVDGDVLGIDRGIVNVSVCSDNSFFNSKRVKNVRGRYSYLRRKLQSAGTPSAKRHLKRLSGREGRFQSDVNHCIAKEIAAKPFAVFALEDLKNIRVQKRRGRNFDRKLNAWAFFQLEQFLRYNAEALGKSVVLVDSRFSSQKCSRCGHTYKGNRDGNDFLCRTCGLHIHADLNASRNIAHAGISCVGRLNVKQPIVASDEAGHEKPR